MQENELFARAALHCLSTLTLRCTENSQALFEAGTAETIVETMKLHPSSRIVQVCMFGKQLIVGFPQLTFSSFAFD